MSDKIKCFHCGDDCGKYPVFYDDKNFCCHGCKTVYDILKGNKLYKYYELESTPGIKTESIVQNEKFAYLDLDEIKKQLIEFQDDTYSKVSLNIPAIHCSSCIWLLENLNRIQPAVIQSQVNFTTKETVILFEHQRISLRQLVELLDSLGYTPHISLESISKGKSKPYNKMLLIKIGVAGFAFGNIMLFSMPYYIPGKELIEEPFRNFFTWLNLVLSLPVLFFCGFDYLRAGLKNLYYRFIDINLPIAIGMLAIFVQSVHETISQTGHGYYDSLSGLIFFLLIGKWYQDKTYRALSFERDYKSYFPAAVLKSDSSAENYIPVEKLAIGDLIIIRNQELIPADGQLQSENAMVDYSFVTGESKPVLISMGQQLFAGGKIIGNAVKVLINKEVQQSRLTELWNREDYKYTDRPPFIRLIDKVSRHFTVIVLAIAVLTAVYWLFVNPSIAIRAATAVLIVACPCALALSIPFGLGNSMRLFGKAGFFLKKSEVIEKIHQCDTFVFDKTGTLTDTSEGEIVYEGDELKDEEKKWIHALVRSSVHPLSRAIAFYLKEYYHPDIQVDDFKEIISSGISGRVETHKILVGSAAFTGAETSFSENAEVWISIDQQVKGKFRVGVKFRNGLKELAAKLIPAFHIHIISGDNEHELPQLKKIFTENTHFAFHLSPVQKLEYIRKLQSEGKKVLMVGDGLNDAGALRESHVGISIADKVFHFSPACDAILEGNQFNKLLHFKRLSSKTLAVIRYSLLISFFYNMAGLYFAVRGMLSPVIAAVLMPASSVTVVAFVVFMTNVIVKRGLEKSGK